MTNQITAQELVSDPHWTNSGDVAPALRPDADLSHESAREWWAALGYHVEYEGETDAEGRLVIAGCTLEHPVCSWERLEQPGSDRDVAQEIAGGEDAPESLVDAYERMVAYARAGRETAEAVADLLVDAVTAYRLGDASGVLSALREAGSLEREYGDDPATSALAERLLEVADA